MVGRAAAAREAVEAEVGRDPVEPGPERHRALEGEGRPAAPGAQERLLNEILSVVEGAEHPVAMHPQLPTVLLE
jgi:hypothetical protein